MANQSCVPSEGAPTVLHPANRRPGPHAVHSDCASDSDVAGSGADRPDRRRSYVSRHRQGLFGRSSRRSCRQGVNTETSFLTETTTQPDGGYHVPYLTPGNYRVSVKV